VGVGVGVGELGVATDGKLSKCVNVFYNEASVWKDAGVIRTIGYW